ncbi:MAG TPA: hypothetical protein VKR83_21455 [Ktedonobacteraceae bacterium]|nr:hypothetical protein [Ktedonobacteraceae bacterium]
MDTEDYTNIVGVFRDRSNADKAIDALKQADFREDQIGLIVYNPDSNEEGEEVIDAPQRGSAIRFIVDVKTDSRELDAVGILSQNGANNSDLPPGIKVVHGAIVNENQETVSLDTHREAESAQQGSSDGLFSH